MPDGVQGPGAEGQSISGSQAKPIDTGNPNQEQQDLARISEITSRPGVSEALNKFDQKFRQHVDQERGTTPIYGIRPDGLVLALSDTTTLAEPGGPHLIAGYYDAWVLDANLPADRIESETLHTRIPGSDVYRMGYGGGLHWPDREDFGELVELPAEKLTARVPDNPDIAGNVELYKKIGGGFTKNLTINVMSGEKLNPHPTAGEQPLYPLNPK